MKFILIYFDIMLDWINKLDQILSILATATGTVREGTCWRNNWLCIPVYPGFIIFYLRAILNNLLYLVGPKSTKKIKINIDTDEGRTRTSTSVETCWNIFVDIPVQHIRFNYSDRLKATCFGNMNFKW